MFTAGERCYICRCLSLKNSTRYSRKREPPSLTEIGTEGSVQVPETGERSIYAEQMNTEPPQKLVL
jgi:hypothetical protein